MYTPHTITFAVPIVIVADGAILMSMSYEDIDVIHEFLQRLRQQLLLRKKIYSSTVDFYLNVQEKSLTVVMKTRTLFVNRGMLLFESLQYIHSEVISSNSGRKVILDTDNAIFEKDEPRYATSYRYNWVKSSPYDKSQISDFLSRELTTVANHLIEVDVDDDFIHLAIRDCHTKVSYLSHLNMIIEADNFYTRIGDNKLTIMG